MELNETGCCAVREIDGLSDYNDPTEALREVIRCLMEEDEDNYDGNYDDDGERTSKVFKVPGFIIFTGVVSCEEKGKYTPCQTGYGEKFEALLKKEKLGVVSVSPARPNRVNHPLHKVKVWTWCPNPKTINAWWKKDQKED